VKWQPCSVLNLIFPHMPRFLIEVPHDATTAACNKAIAVFLRTGSHFLTHADWGCKDNEHKAWLTVDVDSREEARAIVPADYRAGAKVVQLNKFTMEGDRIIKSHPA
jgi:hypothetical protein